MKNITRVSALLFSVVLSGFAVASAPVNASNLFQPATANDANAGTFTVTFPNTSDTQVDFTPANGMGYSLASYSGSCGSFSQPHSIASSSGSYSFSKDQTYGLSSGSLYKLVVAQGGSLSAGCIKLDLPTGTGDVTPLLGILVNDEPVFVYSNCTGDGTTGTCDGSTSTTAPYKSLD